MLIQSRNPVSTLYGFEIRMAHVPRIAKKLKTMSFHNRVSSLFHVILLSHPYYKSAPEASHSRSLLLLLWIQDLSIQLFPPSLPHAGACRPRWRPRRALLLPTSPWLCPRQGWHVCQSLALHVVGVCVVVLVARRIKVDEVGVDGHESWSLHRVLVPAF